jgi:hypothetical protein
MTLMCVHPAWQYVGEGVAVAGQYPAGAGPAAAVDHAAAVCRLHVAELQCYETPYSENRT